MDRKVFDVLRRSGPAEPIVVSPTDSVADAAKQMIHHDVGSALVIDRRDLRGIVARRDVLGLIESEADLAAVMVVEIMTPAPITIEFDTSLRDAIRLMREQDISHLPVTELGRVVSVVSERDIILALAHDLKHENRELKRYIHGPSASAERSYF